MYLLFLINENREYLSGQHIYMVKTEKKRKEKKRKEKNNNK